MKKKVINFSGEIPLAFVLRFIINEKTCYWGTKHPSKKWVNYDFFKYNKLGCSVMMSNLLKVSEWGVQNSIKLSWQVIKDTEKFFPQHKKSQLIVDITYKQPPQKNSIIKFPIAVEK